MKLSILDQSPIAKGKTAADALRTSIKLAKLGDELGYERYWIAEHHDLFGLACPNPAVMLGVIGAQTKRIKLGAGAVLLPYYKPFRVAETYNLLATLFPGRIDLGLGRAPGGSVEVSMALSDNYLEQVRSFPEKIEELLRFLHNGHSNDHPFSKILPTPIPESTPHVWLLGTSEKSAQLAAEKGLPYAFGHFMTDANGSQIVRTYREKLKENHQVPYVIVAVTVICAETCEKAHELALSSLLWKIQQDQLIEEQAIPSISEAKKYDFTIEEQEKVNKIKEKMIIGDQKVVKKRLTQLHKEYKADELMIITITHDERAKFKSYRLIMEQFGEKY